MPRKTVVDNRTHAELNRGVANIWFHDFLYKLQEVAQEEERVFYLVSPDGRRFNRLRGSSIRSLPRGVEPRDPEDMRVDFRFD